MSDAGQSARRRDAYRGGDDHIHAGACRRLWGAVVIAALNEYWGDRQAALKRVATAGMAHSHVERAERYFRSRDGRHVLSLAGIDPNDRAIAGLVSIVAGDVAPLTLMSDQHVQSVRSPASPHAASSNPAPAPRIAGRICAVPGCASVLTPTNRTGVCRRHNHAVGLCGCPTCTDKRKG